MELLYSSLKEEIKAFEEQVQKCRVSFDLQTLQRALSLVSEDHGENLDSWEKIKEYAQSTCTTGEEGLQLRRYFSWLDSYVQYLRAVKEAFDDHVVFRLCDNLYINDEAVTITMPSPIPLSPSNIVSTARQLFHHRRKWGLLLRPEKQETHGLSPSMGLLHCIPDIFEESLVIANLSRNWIRLHEAQNKNPSSLGPPPSQDYKFQLEEVRKEFRANEPAANEETQAELKDMREHLMFLLWRAGRAEALEQQVKDTKQKLQSLEQDINDLQQINQRDGKETSDISLENQKRLEKLQRQLDLEKFHQSIVSCDWQLELEIRPSLIRQIDMVRERCAQLEASGKPQKVRPEASPLASAAGTSDGEWENNSVFSHSSDYSSDVPSTQSRT